MRRGTPTGRAIQHGVRHRCETGTKRDAHSLEAKVDPDGSGADATWTSGTQREHQLTEEQGRHDRSQPRRPQHREGGNGDAYGLSAQAGIKNQLKSGFSLLGLPRTGGAP